MKTNYKCIPFDIELCKKIINKEIKGHIVTRDGRKVRILCTDRKDKPGVTEPYNIIALVAEQDGHECGYKYLSNGKIHFLSETDLDLQIEIPAYYKDYSNFEPQMWQSCLVRDDQEEQWDIRVCFGKNKVGDVVFNEYACTYKYFLPLSKITARLIGTTKSYEQLIQELDAESTATAKNEQQ